jgi:hypothetical protein
MQVDPFQLTGDFNSQVCGLVSPAAPTRLDADRKQWTLAALREEVIEFQDSVTIEDEVDALIDLIYFAAGRMHEMGVDGGRAFAAVHACNMQKLRGTVAKRPGSRGHDAIKPEGWAPPDYGWLTESKSIPSAKPPRIGARVKVGSKDGPVGTIVDIIGTDTVTVNVGHAYLQVPINEVRVL